MTEFETAFKKYRRDMLRSAMRVGLSYQQAEDCVQDAGQKLGQMVTLPYTDVSNLRRLFCRVAHDEAINWIKKRETDGLKERDPSIVDSIHVRVPRMDKTIASAVMVHTALSQLAEIDAIVAWKRFALGMTLEEIMEDLLKEKGITWPLPSLHRHIEKRIKPQLQRILRG